MADLVGDIDPEARDEMFILGVFSLLDKMFSEPFEELLGRLKLPDRVQESLIGNRGPYQPYLRIVEAVEQGPHPKLSGDEQALPAREGREPYPASSAGSELSRLPCIPEQGLGGIGQRLSDPGGWEAPLLFPNQTPWFDSAGAFGA